jgi:hypothetical protein
MHNVDPAAPTSHARQDAVFEASTSIFLTAARTTSLA